MRSGTSAHVSQAKFSSLAFASWLTMDLMESNRRRHKVRVIKDKGKYWRHRLKKLLRKAAKPAIWTTVVLLSLLVMIWVLGWLFRPRPMD